MTMNTSHETHVCHRSEAITRLREKLAGSLDGDRSMCAIAAENGIFCRGFDRWNDHEFDRRWRDHIGRSSHLTRRQMERYADLFAEAERVRCGASIACDAFAARPGPCRGWNEFSNSELAQFCSDLLGDDLIVVD
jgi:hypothetical protein